MQNSDQSATLFGHPTGLYTLFFAEMWERFSYYGMRALLIFYMTKGFLRYDDGQAYAIYGAYTALVYMTPFFGGMVADNLIGARRAVIIGGLLMAGGHLMMGVELEQQFAIGSQTFDVRTFCFFGALSLLIVGNGYFKPNISTIVGSLYRPGSPKRDGGFTIFYMGINLGAAMSPLICGYIGETYGWHYGFGLATIGMLAGLVVFVLPSSLGIVTILLSSLAAAVAMLVFRNEGIFNLSVNLFVSIALVAAAIISAIAMARGGLAKSTGAAPDESRLKRPVAGIIPKMWTVHLSTFALLFLFAFLVYGNKYTLFEAKLTGDDALQTEGSALTNVLQVFATEISKPAGLILALSGLLALGYLAFQTLRLDRIPRQRMYVVLILTFFSMLFWSFFEQAGSSINNFTDRNVDRVAQTQVLEADDVGTTIDFRIVQFSDDEELMQLPLLSQEQLGFANRHADMSMRIDQAIRADMAKASDVSEKEINQTIAAVNSSDALTMTGLSSLRAEARSVASEAKPDGSGLVAAKLKLPWLISADNIGMAIGNSEIPASVFQAANPIYIIIFGLVFTAVWTWLATLEFEPGAPWKFALGLLQLGAGFGILWYGAVSADSRGMVGLVWLLCGYLLHTTGELCLSPVGLSMVTKLSPKRFVSTVMGTWFLATAFSQFLAAIIAQFTTGSGDHGGDGPTTIPIPNATISAFRDVFGQIAIAAVISALICFALAPLLTRWMHVGEDVVDETS